MGRIVQKGTGIVFGTGGINGVSILLNILINNRGKEVILTLHTDNGVKKVVLVRNGIRVGFVM